MHVNRSTFAAARLLLLAVLPAAGLVASTSAPALAQASGTWALTGSMRTAREGQTATLLPTGQVLAAGGIQGSAALASAELYNPATGKWSATGSMNTGRAGQTATLLPSGQVLVAGGYNLATTGSCSLNVLATAELYNPAAGTWTNTGSMSIPRLGQTATLLPDGQVLVAGGATTSSTCALGIAASAELYNPATGTWAKTGSMSAPRENHTATLLPNGQVLVAGGYNDADPFNHSLATAELYNPAAGSWATTGSLNTPRFGHQAVLLANRQVLVADGAGISAAGTFELNSTEVYDPATGRWTTTGNTFQAGSGFSLTLLNTGKVLIAGGPTGVYPHTGISRAAELYDPATATSASTGSMNVPRDDQSATPLPNGQVLVAGARQKPRRANSPTLPAPSFTHALTSVFPGSWAGT